MTALPIYLESMAPGWLDAALVRLRLVVFDFDGVFTDNRVYVDQDGRESVCCWRGDGIGLSRLRALDVAALILSTEVNPVVTARASKLRLPCRQGVDDKAAALLEILDERAIEPSQAAFVGNDVNDIPAFHVVGLPIAVADACSEVLPHVRYRTALPGGRGAVREVCDLIHRARLSDESRARRLPP